MKSRQRLVDQERAKKAWECINEVKGQEYAKEYGSLVKGAPANIQINGLGQTVAFWRAKGFDRGKPKVNNAHSKLFGQISKRVIAQMGLVTNEKEDLLSWIVNHASTEEYRRATAEAITFLSWLKRFAEAELGDDEQ